MYIDFLSFSDAALSKNPLANAHARKRIKRGILKLRAAEWTCAPVAHLLLLAHDSAEDGGAHHAQGWHDANRADSNRHRH